MLEPVNIADQQNEIAKNVYQQLANIIFTKINTLQMPKRVQEKLLKPFVTRVKAFNGCFVSPLSDDDVLEISSIINQAIAQIDLATEAGDLLCDSVIRFFTDFKVCFSQASFNENTNLDYSRIFSGRPVVVGRSEITFWLNGADRSVKIALLHRKLEELARVHFQKASQCSQAATSVHESVIKTLVYNQAHLIQKVHPSDQEQSHYLLICLVDLRQRKKTTVKLLLARIAANNGFEAFFEVACLRPESTEYQQALRLCGQLSVKLQAMLLKEKNEYSVDTEISSPKIKLAASQLRELFLAIQQQIASGQECILPLLAAKKQSTIVINHLTGDENQERSQPKKRGTKEASQQLVSLERVVKRKRQVTASGEQIAERVAHIYRGTDQKELQSYLQHLQANTLQKIIEYTTINSRRKTKSFALDKIKRLPSSLLSDQELNALTSFLQKTRLYPYQQEGVKKILACHAQGFGVCLADEMSLGKTLQIGAAIQFLLTKEQCKSFLVLVPLQVLLKWQSELTDKLKFNNQKVLLYHGKSRELSYEDFTGKNVIITTPETLLSELKKKDSTELKRALGFISKNIFKEFDMEDYRKWLKLIRNLPENYEHLVKINKHTKRTKVLRFPVRQELEELSRQSEFSISSLRDFFSAELLLQYLEQEEYLSEEGALIKQLADIKVLEPLFAATPELTSSMQEVYDVLQTAWNDFALSGIVVDEGHNGLSKTESVSTSFCKPIAKMLSARNGLRVISTGTPLLNDIEELWTIHDFLNPGALLEQHDFMSAYANLLYKAGGAICDAAELMGSEALDRSQQAVQNAAKKVQFAYEQLNGIVSCLQERQIRRTKELIGRNLHQTVAARNYSLPARTNTVLAWTFSDKQTELYGQQDAQAIEDACRGFAFINRDLRNSGNGSKKGLILLQDLAKIFDHPILRQERHHAALFEGNRTLESIDTYLRDLIEREYGNDVNKFIQESGKLTVLFNLLKDLLKEKDARILIATEFIPMIAIINLAVKYIDASLRPILYSGGMQKENREAMLGKFNNPDNNPANVKHRVLIISQRAGSEGIDAFAKYAINYDQTWTFAKQEQMFSRAHRNGSSYKEITCFSLKGENPLDNKMTHCVVEKQEWAKWFVDNNLGCHSRWFVDRLCSLIKTSPLFGNFDLAQERVLAAANSIKTQLEQQESLSLDRVNQLGGAQSSQPQQLQEDATMFEPGTHDEEGGRQPSPEKQVTGEDSTVGTEEVMVLGESFRAQRLPRDTVGFFEGRQLRSARQNQSQQTNTAAQSAQHSLN